jgi:flagellar protein FliS
VEGYGRHYQTQAVETASPAQLVLMLYDRALQSLIQVQQAKLPDDLEFVNRELQRAQDIVTELRLALDFERGGAIAPQLSALYGFCLQRLIEANVRKKLDQIEEVRSVLAGLRDAWDEACVRSDTLVGQS